MSWKEKGVCSVQRSLLVIRESDTDIGLFWVESFGTDVC